MRQSLLIACLLATALYGADNSKVWTGAEIKSLEKKMAATKEKVGTESLAVLGNYQMSVAYRNASGQAELHQTKNDIFYMISGSCTLVTGGTIPNAKTTQPHELRGAAVSGGQKRKIGPGDFLTIPAGVPHQMLLDPGTEITYAVVKVNTK
jgi:uncharacterized RmlC-like cupin family protein